ncbi:MAG: hypothetical protein E7671_00400 [Ruminococcaceae bacterium]|nr:hypothetical protein [Oscillospiraceae bacterium]
MRFRDRLVRFMYGRYGADELYRFLTIAFYVVFFVNLVVRSYVLSALTIAILVWSVFRMFSKNIYARRLENQKYLKIKNSVASFFKLGKDRFRDRKTHVYRKCPKCRAVLRLPKRKGKHTVRCPRCSDSFEVKV